MLITFIYSKLLSGAWWSCANPEGGGRGSGPFSGKSQVAVGFLRNSGMDPLKKVNEILREVCMTLCKIR